MAQLCSVFSDDEVADVIREVRVKLSASHRGSRRTPAFSRTVVSAVALRDYFKVTEETLALAECDLEYLAINAEHVHADKFHVEGCALCRGDADVTKRDIWKMGNNTLPLREVF